MGKAPKFRTPEADGDAPVEPKKPSKLVALLMIVFGLILGGGGATAYFLFLAPGAAHEAADAPAEPEETGASPEFVEINRLTIPLIAPDGSLSGYMNLEMKFEVADQDADFMKARIPMVRHAINETLSHTSIADRNNPQQLDYATAARVLREAANRALKRDIVRSVQITMALPI